MSKTDYLIYTPKGTPIYMSADMRLATAEFERLSQTFPGLSLVKRVTPAIRETVLWTDTESMGRAA